MLSLIICSRTPSISNELATNIAKTIGCEYELVIIDNSKNEYSIFSAYNEGVRRANGDVLCFMHDDILYKTQNWGPQVEETLKDKTIGVVGVIGSYILTKDYGYWDMMYPFVTGYVPCEKIPDNDCNCFSNLAQSNNVVAVDGMWFSASKNLFKMISFDENTYNGFHFYDMDICMQSLSVGYKNVIIRDLIIKHNCAPQCNLFFVENMGKFHKKWSHALPICSINIDKSVINKIHNQAMLHCQALSKATIYESKYLSVLNSHAFRLGCFLLKPIYILKSLLKRK